MLDILNCFVWLFCYPWLLCLIVMLDCYAWYPWLLGFLQHLWKQNQPCWLFTPGRKVDNFQLQPFLLQVEAASIFSLAGCWSPSTSRIASDLDKYVTGEGTLCTKCWVPCLTMNIEQVACFLLSTSTSYLLTLQRKFQTNEWSDDEQIASSSSLWDTREKAKLNPSLFVCESKNSPHFGNSPLRRRRPPQAGLWAVLTSPHLVSRPGTACASDWAHC